ncbi:hypothetical protein XaC1_177 [Xanthomonas phage XaC1]|nr:hypothetical protein XaC1_177 [Xanthomonas phage XaC1]
MFFTIVGVIVVLIICVYCLLLGVTMFLGNLALSNKGGEMWFGLVLIVSSLFIGYETIHNSFNISFSMQTTESSGTK